VALSEQYPFKKAVERVQAGGDFISGEYEFGQQQDIDRFKADRAALEGTEGSQAAQTYARQATAGAGEAAGVQAQGMISQLQAQLQSGAISPAQYQQMVGQIQSGTQTAAGQAGGQALDAYTQLRDQKASEIQDRLTQSYQFGQQATLQEWQLISNFLGGGSGATDAVGGLMQIAALAV